MYEQKEIILIEDDIQRQSTKLEDIKILNEENFLDFQNLIRTACGLDRISPPVEDEDPRIKKMKAKARYRDKVKAEKGIGLKLSSTLLSIFCMGVGLNPLNIGEVSYPVIQAIIRQYQEKEKYETDIKSLLAGADSKKVKPKYWIRNIED